MTFLASMQSISQKWVWSWLCMFLSRFSFLAIRRFCPWTQASSPAKRLSNLPEDGRLTSKVFSIQLEIIWFKEFPRTRPGLSLLGTIFGDGLLLQVRPFEFDGSFFSFSECFVWSGELRRIRSVCSKFWYDSLQQYPRIGSKLLNHVGLITYILLRWRFLTPTLLLSWLNQFKEKRELSYQTRAI